MGDSGRLPFMMLYSEVPGLHTEGCLWVALAQNGNPRSESPPQSTVAPMGWVIL